MAFGQKPCLGCKNPISIDASKCQYCTADQHGPNAPTDGSEIIMLIPRIIFALALAVGAIALSIGKELYDWIERKF